MSDVTVVGAGVVGLSAAWLLARRGASVTVVDAGPVGGGASHAAQGELVPPATVLAPLWRRSLKLYAELSRQTGMWWDEEPVGTLVLAADDPGELAMRQAAEEGRVLTGAALRAAEPALGDGLAAGRLMVEGRRLEPAAVLDHLATAARRAGAVINAGCGAVRLARDGAGWSVRCPGGTRFDSPYVLLAAGLGTRDLLAPLGHRVPLAGVRGTVVVTGPAPFALRHVLAEAVIGQPGSVALLAHQMPSGQLVVGGSWHPAELPGPAGLPEAIMRRAARLVPAAGALRVVAQRSGVRPCLPDRLPVADRVEPGLYGCFGHAGEGFIAGPGSAELVADLIAEAAAGAVTARQETSSRTPFAFGRWSNDDGAGARREGSST
ncbi:NAD(P)/FAD-dependent oxidoreductase [Streptomyces hygroscopicus]|uniref:NAD(P)/FAD-dependent oxidoreductase n=1 Tax=Streptomyces hygroscopicus TaxID=1912 RepID=UPI0004C702B9|nr:FAD-dependent oxidoreductase [Streptomyces hygroscopicus]